MDNPIRGNHQEEELLLLSCVLPNDPAHREPSSPHNKTASATPLHPTGGRGSALLGQDIIHSAGGPAVLHVLSNMLGSTGPHIS